MANILITTTPVLSNIEIKRYICPLTANVVLGVNFFSDFAASITDMFGGNSEVYQEKLDILNNQVGTLIQKKAARVGANAVLDYKLSFNEISGKGKQMFMVTATGTACVIVMPKEESIEKIGQATYSQIRKQYYITLYTKRLESQGELALNDWDNIFALNLTEIADPLTKEYLRLKNLTTTDYHIDDYKNIYLPKYIDFLSGLNKPLATKTIYAYLQKYPDSVIALALKCNLFSPKAALELFDSGKVTEAIKLLTGHKEIYTSEDLKLMKEIVSKLDSLPDKGHYQTVKSGMFSKKEEEVYICPNGHKTSKKYQFCPEINCGLNIKGLNSNQDRTIRVFKSIVEALDTILNNTAKESEDTQTNPDAG